MTSSHMVLGSAGMLLAIGLVMVFSASSIEAALDDQPAWLPGVRQIVFAVLGLVAMLVAMHLPIGRIRRFAGWGMIAAFGLLTLVLVPGLGVELNGSRAWFDLKVTNFQPSELAKLVFALWGAHVIALRERYLTTRSLLVPVLPAFALMSLLLLAEPDMGAVVSLSLVVAGLMWAGGLSRRYIAGAVGLAAALVALMVAVAPYRAARITAFLDPFADPSDGGYQAIHGFYALASGGVAGVGLGNSAMKWNLLPHAESDYIFAIIGEEMGFLGCLVVISLYAVLAWAGFRIARRSADRFVQLASIAITVWLIGQATMNMGYVVGLLPVTGVTLPLISAGGTSLVLTLFIVGLLARFARAEPAAVAHLQSQPRGRLARLFSPAPAIAVDPIPARRRSGSRGSTRSTSSPRPVERFDRRGEPLRGVRPDPAGPRDLRAVRRTPGPAPARAPRPPGWGPTPEERWAPADRQTVRSRQPAGDRPSVLRRPPSAAGPVPRDVPRDVPRERSWSGDPSTARARPAPRSHPPRTERPGRLQ
ncbi:putative lipid II flippase FtsW [Modestobacter sp. L9-4]|uniref:putative lipid II flippase FtsW n=1 Tax=Modestobacter sp. L9-4 TaxID=2851567 RepID=UPI001F0137E3|nr:putative lipid II flippase FtsW [Modestobacter sp. L9-4]